MPADPAPPPGATARSAADPGAPPPLRGTAALGAELRAAGLVPRALAAWAGTERIAALPPRIAALAARPPGPAAAALALFVAGGELPRAAARALPIDALAAAGLVEQVGERVRARCAVLPLGPGLLVCDRADAPAARDQVCWPDDSSYHLARAIPAGRRARWIDLGCGSAFAAIARPGLASEILGEELSPRGVACARAGLALSGVGHADAVRADATRADPGAPRAELVTCNAPIPGDPHPARWRSGDAGIVARLLAALPARLAPGGLAIVHTAREAVPADLAGEVVFVAYAPEPPTFGVLWWRPDAPARRAEAARALTPDRPHLDSRDREDALASAG